MEEFYDYYGYPNYDIMRDNYDNHNNWGYCGYTLNFPNGEQIDTRLPTYPCIHFSCDFAGTRTLLLKKGRFWWERQAVKRSMQYTIVQHTLQENGGGVFSTYNVMKVEKIHNNCLWRRFILKSTQIVEEGAECCNERMLFHGSSEAQTIIQTGFDMSKADPNGMFGKAIYFAKHSSKSNQYVYGHLGGDGCPTHKDKSCYVCERVMLLCRVTLGRMFKQYSANKMERPPPGYHSVVGKPATGGLRYPEYAVYDPDQVYPEYMITYKLVR